MNFLKKGKIIGISLTVGIITLVSAVSAAAESYDFNQDGNFDVQDVTYFQNIVSNGAEIEDYSLYDINNDGTVNVNDVSSLQIKIS